MINELPDDAPTNRQWNFNDENGVRYHGITFAKVPKARLLKVACEGSLLADA